MLQQGRPPDERATAREVAATEQAAAAGEVTATKHGVAGEAAAA
jgi:hypothetical protein